MKQTLFVLVFIILINNVKSQNNIVPNNSFENYSTCPFLGEQINFAIPWVRGNGESTDYFNACASVSSGVGVPINSAEYQFAKTGNGYAGFFGHWHGNGTNYDINEYVEAPLDSTLIAGRRYCVSFYLSYATPYIHTYNLVSITEIGAYFSDTLVWSYDITPLPFTPQVVSPAGVFLNDTANWVQISGTFIAEGGEKYITIGNFKPFGQTDTLGFANTSNPISTAYYYIDDVSVVDCTGQGVNEHNEDNTITITPNPSEALFQVSSFRFDIESVKVFNVLGEAMNSEQVTGNSVTIDLTGFSRGVYFVEVKTDASASSATGGIVRKKIIKQ